MKVRIVTSYADNKGNIHKAGDVIELENAEARYPLEAGQAVPAPRSKTTEDKED